MMYIRVNGQLFKCEEPIPVDTESVLLRGSPVVAALSAIDLENYLDKKKDTMTTLNNYVDRAYTHAKKSGFHDHTNLQDVDQFNTKLLLIVSEVTETMEELRKGAAVHKNWQSFPNKPEGVPAELADVVIRLLDLAGAIKNQYPEFDLEEVINEKMAYNETRPRMHGKEF